MAMLQQGLDDVSPKSVGNAKTGPRSVEPSPSTASATKKPPSASKAELVSSLLEKGQDSQTPDGDKSWWRRLRPSQAPEHKFHRPFKCQFEGDIRSVERFSPGYSKVAAYMDADPGFKIFRKFGWLHNFALLELQDELQQLEERLERLLKREETYGEKINLISRRQDLLNKKSRRDLMSAIQQKLIQYDDLILRTQQMQAMERPLPRYQNSVFHAVTNESNMQGSEGNWIYRSDDLAAISDDVEHGWFNGFVEDILSATSRRGLLWIFRNQELKQRTGDGNDNLVSPKRMDVLIRTVLTIALSVELLVPLLVLNAEQLNNPSQAQKTGYYQIAIIFGSTLLFSASCSLFTRAKRHEVFAATAAYCAVLVVFLGNSSYMTIVPQAGPPHPAV